MFYEFAGLQYDDVSTDYAPWHTCTDECREIYKGALGRR